ncbi:MAG: hypothetical protein M0R03_20810 [Novosphingobium sp.]|nr:hypothetical protein [Novosphingobium sp.]
MTTKKSEILIRVQPELKEKAKEYADSKKWSLSTLGESAIKLYLHMVELIEEPLKISPEEYIEKCKLEGELINDFIAQTPKDISKFEDLIRKIEKEGILEKFEAIEKYKTMNIEEDLKKIIENQNKMNQEIELLKSKKNKIESK